MMAEMLFTLSLRQITHYFLSYHEIVFDRALNVLLCFFVQPRDLLPYFLMNVFFNFSNGFSIPNSERLLMESLCPSIILKLLLTKPDIQDLLLTSYGCFATIGKTKSISSSTTKSTSNISFSIITAHDSLGLL